MLAGASLILENVSLRYPNNANQRPSEPTSPSVDRISLNLGDGDRLAIIGRNGSGKTTLLRLLSGIYHPTSGRIWSSGRKAAILSATSGFEPDATGYENIFLRGMLLGMTRAEVKRALPDITRFADLGDALKQPLSNYSSGMALRLAFAICTSMRPQILIFDEWIGVGDAVFMERAQHRLDRMLDAASMLILASHSEAIISQFCTRAIVIEGGRIGFDGPVDAALAYYRELISVAQIAAYYRAESSDRAPLHPVS